MKEKNLYIFFFCQEHFRSIPLTESQLHDIARRDKLQRLRAQEDNINQNQINLTPTSPTEPVPSLSSVAQSSVQINHIEEQQQSSSEGISSAPDLLKDHIDGEHARRQKKVFKSLFIY
jgi:hypothetical protein